jgi:hypothetical protein
MKTILLTIILGLTIPYAKAQLTAEILEKAYRNHNWAELDSIFELMVKQTDSIRIANENDTTILISQLITTILKNNWAVGDISYFFLQEHFPNTTIGEKRFFNSTSFCPNVTYDKLIPLVFNKFNIYEINIFLGPIITGNSRNFLRFTNNKKLKIQKDRTAFIGKFLRLLDRSLVPINFAYLEFNVKMDEVEVRHDDGSGSSGAIEIYKLINGNWNKTETIMSWME